MTVYSPPSKIGWYVKKLLSGKFFFFSSRRRHTRYIGDWSSDVCSSDLLLNQWLGWPRACQPSHWFRRRSRAAPRTRSEERRVGKEGRCRWSGRDEKKKKESEIVGQSKRAPGRSEEGTAAAPGDGSNCSG